MELQDYQKQFISFLSNEKILSFGEFTTKSGRKSPYFINFGLCANGFRVSFLSRILAKHVHQVVEEKYTALYGPAYKGITLASSVSKSLYEGFSLNVDFFYNRKEAKSYGEGGQVVGGRSIQATDELLLIDDVITSGKSIQESQEIIQSFGAKAVAMVICVDRMEKLDEEQSALEVFKSQGLNIYPIVNIVEIIRHLDEEGSISQGNRVRINDYWKKYGVGEEL